MADLDSLFSVPASVFFFGLICFMLCLLVTCVVLNRLCRTIERRYIVQGRIVIPEEPIMSMDRDSPPPYSLPPSYEDALKQKVFLTSDTEEGVEDKKKALTDIIIACNAERDQVSNDSKLL
ncbi:uncharacterized protein LOC129222691 [Uloborus diversus]|uniref:uncharacterized protein LOC129222691 n=1 Tax=Uloborus diversus TaxID=327109 RepID=UPI00240A626C|nr:uncharacterized protein LOC129222691 [Uloborus diversus]